jgi:hypothetical protein
MIIAVFALTAAAFLAGIACPLRTRLTRRTLPQVPPGASPPAWTATPAERPPAPSRPLALEGREARALPPGGTR